MVTASKSGLVAVIAVLSVAFATAAGTARLSYRSVSPSSCPTNCVTDGYNVAWDAGGIVTIVQKNI